MNSNVDLLMRVLGLRCADHLHPYNTSTTERTNGVRCIQIRTPTN